MIFLITYDRRHGTLVTMTQFQDADLEKANDQRLESEVKNAANSDIEIVILRSASEEELRRTHARYFKTLSQLERL